MKCSVGNPGNPEDVQKLSLSLPVLVSINGLTGHTDIQGQAESNAQGCICSLYMNVLLYGAGGRALVQVVE